MNLPGWIPRQGRPLHAVVGLGYTVVMFLVALAGNNPGFGAVANFCGVLGLALAHEQSDCNGVTWSDFRHANGGPVNGLLDVLSFFPAPALWLLIAWAS